MKSFILLFLLAFSFNSCAGPCEDITYLMGIAHKKFREIRGDRIQQRWEIEGSKRREYTPTFLLDGASECTLETEPNSADYRCEWNASDEEQLNEHYYIVVNQLNTCLSDFVTNVREIDKGKSKSNTSITFSKKAMYYDIGDNISVNVVANNRQSLRTMKINTYLYVEVSYLR